MQPRRFAFLVSLAALVLPCSLACALGTDQAAVPGGESAPGEGGSSGEPGGGAGEPACPGGVLEDGRSCAPVPPEGVASESCPGGSIEEPSFTGGGLCLPERPRKSSEGCPGASYTHAATGESFAICLPEAPRLESWSCSAGWFARAAFSDPQRSGLPAHDLCEPPTLPTCGAGELAVPGSVSCVRQGAGCGAAPFPAEAALRARAPGHGGAVRYVDPAAAPGGDGSRAAPFALPGDALAASAQGDLLALSAGAHQGPLVLDRGVALVGACTGGTTLLAPAGALAITISAPDEVLLADLTLVGGGIEVDPGSGGTRLDGVTVTGAVGVGIRTRGSESLLELTDVVVEGTLEGSDPDGGFGLRLEGGGTAVLTRVALEGNSGTALSVGGPSTVLHAEGLTIRGTTGRALDGDGRGLRIRDGAVAEVHGLVVEGGVGIGVVAGEAANLRLEDALITGVGSRADGNLGRGVTIMSGANATLHRVLVVDDREYGIAVIDAGSALVADQLLIGGVEPSGLGAAGRGLQAVGGASVTLSRTIVRRAHEVGIALFEPGTTLEATDVVVFEMQPDSEGYLGRGFAVLDGAALVGARVVVTACAETGLFARGAGSAVTLTDVAVTATDVEEATGRWGYGLSADDSAMIDLKRVLLAGNTGCGACGRDGGALLLHDALIRGTRPLPSGQFGRGGGADRGGSFRLSEAAVVENHEASLFAADPGSRLVVQDVLVADTLAEEASGQYGGGVVLLLGATATVTRALVTDSNQVGASVDGAGSTLQLTDVEIVDVPGIAAEGTLGRGIEVKNGGRLEGEVVQLAAISEAALAVVDPGSEVVLRGLVVRGGTNPLIPLGRGLNVQEGAHVVLGPALFVGASDLGVAISHPGTSVSLSDLVVRSTESDAVGSSGTGLVAQLGASVTLRRAVFVENRDVGLIAVSPDTVLDAGDLVISTTRDGACHELTCYAGGTGAGTYDGGLLRLQDFWVDGNPLVGVQVAVGGRIEARRGLVSRNGIGVNVAVEGLDLDAAFVEVRTHGNGRDLDALELPLPKVVEPP